MLRIFICVVFGLECSRYKQAYIEYESKQRDQIATIAETKKGSLSLGNCQAAKNSIFNVLQEARSNGRTFVT